MPIKITDTIKPYIPRIPAITTGTIDFTIISGFNIPSEQIPIPDWAVPIAAPRSINVKISFESI